MNYISKKPEQQGKEKPTVVTGLNIKKKAFRGFGHQLQNTVNLIGDFSDDESLRDAALTHLPDLVVIMREGKSGGIAQADKTALWLLRHSLPVLLIVGELDAEGLRMDNEVKDAGGFVLSCQPGTDISVFELMYLINSIMAELQEDAEDEPDERKLKPGKAKLQQADPKNHFPEREVTEEAASEPEETIEIIGKEEMYRWDEQADNVEQASKVSEQVSRLDTPLPPEQESSLPDNLSLSKEKPSVHQATEREKSTREVSVKGSCGILLATGHPGIDEELAGLLPANSLTLAGECYDRRVVEKVAAELQPDTVIISPFLKGEGNLVAIIRTLRDRGVRVVVLPGDLNNEETRNLVRELIPLGIYDYVFDQVKTEKIIKLLRAPACLGDVPRMLVEPALLHQTIGREVVQDLPVEPEKKPSLWKRLQSKFRKPGVVADTAADTGVADYAVISPGLGETTGENSRENSEASAGKGVEIYIEENGGARDGESINKNVELSSEKNAGIGSIGSGENKVAGFATGLGDDVNASDGLESKIGFGNDSGAGGGSGISNSKVVAFVSPWRPSLAGLLAAAAAKMAAAGARREIAVIGASGSSTVAGRLNISEDELIMSDWRVLGSQVPVERDNIKIWAVDPAKSLHIPKDTDVAALIPFARDEFSQVIIDCANDHELAAKLLFQDVAIVYIVPGQDRIEQQTSLLWLNRLKITGKMIVWGVDLREATASLPEGLNPDMMIKGSPEEALKDLWRRNPSLLERAN